MASLAARICGKGKKPNYRGELGMAEAIEGWQVCHLAWRRRKGSGWVAGAGYVAWGRSRRPGSTWKLTWAVCCRDTLNRWWWDLAWRRWLYKKGTKPAGGRGIDAAGLELLVFAEALHGEAWETRSGLVVQVGRLFDQSCKWEGRLWRVRGCRFVSRCWRLWTTMEAPGEGFGRGMMLCHEPT